MKKSSGFFNRAARITLPAGSRRSFGKSGGRWYISYLEDGVEAREWTDATSRDEAIAARDRRFIELAMAGAKREGEKAVTVKKKPLPPRSKRSPDRFICRVRTTKQVVVLKYRVVVRGTVVGTSDTIADARRMRDDYERKHLDRIELKACTVCGKHPTRSQVRPNAYRLVHDEDGCINKVEIRRPIGKQAQSDLWNTEFYKR